MTGGFTLDKPEQINAWVLLSRMHQAELQMKGYPTKGLVKWFQRNVPGCENLRTVKACYPFLLDLMDEYGCLPEDHEAMCNYWVWLTAAKGNHLRGLWIDRGVFSTMDEVEAEFGEIHAADPKRVVIQRTMEAPREPNADRWVFPLDD